MSKAPVLRRFDGSLVHFHTLHGPLAESWRLFKNSGSKPLLLNSGH